MGLQQQLGGEMALLGELRIVERGVRRLEVCATVLHVCIKEEAIKPSIQIVMRCNVPLGARGRIELLPVPDQVAEPPQRFRPAGQHVRLVQHDRKHVGDCALFDNEAAVHVDLAEREFRIKQQAPCGGCCGESHSHRGTGTIAAGEFSSCRRRESNRAPSDETAQEELQQTIHQAHVQRSKMWSRQTSSWWVFFGTVSIANFHWRPRCKAGPR